MCMKRNLYYLMKCFTVTSGIIFLFILNIDTNKKKIDKSIELPEALYQVNPWADNIIFIVAQASLTSKQTCAIESAARANPDKKVNVLFNIAHINNSIQLKVLDAYHNVYLAHINIRLYTKFTRLASMTKSADEIFRSSDVMKFIAMSIHPGIYLDLDIITVNKYDGLASNFVVSYDNNKITFGVFAIRPWRKSAKKLKKAFMGKIFSQLALKVISGKSLKGIGDEVLKESLVKFCGTSYVPDMNFDTCQGLTVYRNDNFVINDAEVERYLKYGIYQNGITTTRHKIYAASLKTIYQHTRITETLNFYFPSMAATYCPLMLKHSEERAFLYNTN